MSHFSFYQHHINININTKDTINKMNKSIFSASSSSYLYAFLFSCLLFVATAPSLMAQAQIPQPMSPPRLVNDFANIIPNQLEPLLERKLVRYNNTTSTQVTVVSVASLHGDEPYSIAQSIMDTWGVGQKGKDNGVVILIAPNERKSFISTGYGVEGVLTDAACKRIVDDYMIPEFKQGKYYAGVDSGTEVMFKLLTGEFTADQVGRGDDSGFDVFIVFFILFIILFIVLPAMQRRGHTYSHDGRQRRGGGFMPPIIIWGGGGGHDDFDDFSSGGGVFGGGGGGFGGFGGGMGGGGGAGGSW